jgi:hypothetical protein
MRVSLLCFVQRLIKSERKFDRHVKDGRRQAPGGNCGQGDAHTNVQDNGLFIRVLVAARLGSAATV